MFVDVLKYCFSSNRKQALRQKRKKRIKMLAQQAKQATKIATKVTLNNNKKNSGSCHAAKTRKTDLAGSHLGQSSNNNTLSLQLGHCSRMDDYETDNYCDSFHTQKYFRSLPTRIVWSVNNTQYSSKFTSDSSPRRIAIFHDGSDTGQMGGSRAGLGQQSLPIAVSRSKPAVLVQNGDINSMLREVRQDPGVRKLCRVKYKAQRSEKTLDAAHEDERQSSGAATGAHIEQRMGGSLNNAKKMTLTLKVEPQSLNKTVSMAEPSQQNAKSLVTARDTSCIPDSHSVIGQRSVTITLLHSSCLSVSSKVQVAHEPDTSAEKLFLQNGKDLVAPSETGKESCAATGAMNQQSIVGSLQNSALRERPTTRSSATARVQPSVAKLLVPVSNCGVYFSDAKPKKTSLQSDMSLVISSRAGRQNSGAPAGVKKEQPTGDFFKNNATEVTPVSAARSPVPFSNSHGPSLGKKSKPTNGTTSVGKQSQQSEKSLLAGSSLPNSHRVIRQSSVPTVLGNSSKLNIKFKVQKARQAGISVNKSSKWSEKSLVIPHGAGRQSSGTGIGAQKERTTGVSLKNSARKGTSCLRCSSAIKPAQTPSARVYVSVSSSEDHPGTKPKQIKQTNSVDKPCQQSEKSSVNAHHTNHFWNSYTLFGQSSTPPAFVRLSNLNVTCQAQVSHKPGTSLDKPSQQSKKKNVVTSHKTAKQNSGAATSAQREQPMGGSLKKSIEKVTPSFVSVSKSRVHSSGSKPEQTTKSKPVETSAARLPVPVSNSYALSFGEKPKPTNNSTPVEKPSPQREKTLVAESNTSDVPESHNLIDQSLIPPATNAKHLSNLSTSCNIGLAQEPGPSLDKPQSKKTLVMCDAGKQNSVAVTGSQSKQPVGGSVKSSSKKVTPEVWWSAAARSLASVSNFGSHPSVRLEQSSGQSNEATKGAQRKQPTDDFLVSVSNLNNIPTDTKPEQTNKNTSLDNQFWHGKKNLVAVHDAGEQSSGALVGAPTEGNHQPMDGSPLSVSISNVHPADVNPESTNKNTSVDNPTLQCKSSVTGLESSIPNTSMQSSDPNDKFKVRMAHQPGNVRNGGTRFSSAQVEKPSEVKSLHRYAAHLNSWIYSLSFNKPNFT